MHGGKKAIVAKYGIEMGSAAIGTAFEFAAPGMGPMVAAGVSVALEEFLSRSLSRKERARVGSLGAMARERISAALLAGRQLRADDFFAVGESGEPPSVELFEASLLKARDEPEAKKLVFIAAFYANLLFTEGLSPDTAHSFLNTLQRVTFHQICLLSFVAQEGELDVKKLRTDGRSIPEILSLAREEMDLQSNDLGTLGLLEASSPWRSRLTPLGRMLVELAALNEVEPADLARLRSTLNEVERNGVPRDANASGL